ncbi:MAG TPA: rod shape-determining protein MreD [Gemmatimonadaceae bacterium]|nr:rod shape-determining protein MreD [Gemmatimonadaceae bacterium]
MRPIDLARTLLAFVVLVLLHFTLRPLLGWRVGPDFLIIALLLVAIRVRPGAAAVLGLVMGVVADSIELHAFGAGALAMCCVGFAASWLKAVFFADDMFLNAFFFFSGKWAFDTIFILAEHRVGGVELLRELLVWSPITAVVTALWGLLTLLILRPILRPSRT